MGGHCLRDNFPGGQLSGVDFSGGNSPGGNYPRGNYTGVIFN